MKRILVGFIMDGKAGGIDKYLINLLQNVNRDEITFDFLTTQNNTSELKNELEKYDSKLYKVVSLKHPFLQYRQICNIINQNHYEGTYFNISTAISCIGPCAAHYCKVNEKIIHSHSTYIDCNNQFKRKFLLIIHYLCKMFLYKKADKFFACSYTAGLWMFPKHIVNSNSFHVINNAIDINQFKYNPKVRDNVREKLNIHNHYVIGHVGNFCYQKNQEFLICILREALKIDDSCILMLIGDGPDFESTKQLAHEFGIEKQVVFLGRRMDVHELMQAMDVFVLPSRFEGFGIVAIEAQAAGLPCVLSDKVPQEVVVSKNVRFLKLTDTAFQWAQVLLNWEKSNRNSETGCRELIQLGFDLATQSKSVQKLL